MVNYLKELCKDLGVNLIFTNNKLTILSSTVHDNIPVLRVHKIFKKCPEKLAKSIVGYYSDFKHSNKHLITIENYINNKFPEMEYTIKPPDRSYKDLLSKTVNLSDSNTIKSPLVELDITFISQKDFWGNITDIDPDEGISPTEEDFLELDIVVKDLNT